MDSFVVRISKQALLAAILSAVSGFAVAQSDGGKLKPARETDWREYAYPTDGFAAKFPYAPTPHKDTQVPDGTAYTVSLPGSTFTLHVANFAEGCSARFTQYVG